MHGSKYIRIAILAKAIIPTLIKSNTFLQLKDKDCNLLKEILLIKEKG
jgi:hypothetical protein